jgi:uncharacterized membrane protein
LLLRFALAEGARVEVSAYRDRASDDLLMNVTYAGDGPPTTVAITTLKPISVGAIFSVVGAATVDSVF